MTKPPPDSNSFGTFWTEQEIAVIRELVTLQEMSPEAVLRNALRLYQLHVKGVPQIPDKAAQPVEAKGARELLDKLLFCVGERFSDVGFNGDIYRYCWTNEEGALRLLTEHAAHVTAELTAECERLKAELARAATPVTQEEVREWLQHYCGSGEAPQPLLWLFRFNNGFDTVAALLVAFANRDPLRQHFGKQLNGRSPTAQQHLINNNKQQRP